MQALNILQHKFNLINQTNEPRKEHVKISDTAKFQGCWPNTHNMADIGKTKIRAKCRIILPPKIPRANGHSLNAMYHCLSLVFWFSGVNWSGILSGGSCV